MNVINVHGEKVKIKDCPPAVTHRFSERNCATTASLYHAISKLRSYIEWSVKNPPLVCQNNAHSTIRRTLVNL